MVRASFRPAWAEVDLDAVQANACALVKLAAPAALCAVVKADAYGHGAPAVARAALSGGAGWLAVALVDEGIELREAGIDAPVLVLSEATGAAAAAGAEAGLTFTVCSPAGLDTLALVAGGGRRIAVHLKVDTGMHRLGVPPEQALDLARRLAGSEGLRFEGLWTHLAVADVEGDPFTAVQLQRFEEVRAVLGSAGLRPALLHAANSAGAIAHPASRYDMVRCGIALYGYPPVGVPGELGLRPALSLRARVSALRPLPAGARPSYGRRRPLPSDAVVATVPLGYADGVPRRLLDAGAAGFLVGGRRRPLAGVVTMDQLMLDLGADGDVRVGDEVTLIGEQGAERITAEDWAAWLGTISYEVLTGIGPRVERRYRGGEG
ncbi:MAG TPA: alanine racemase [Acidimicrobiales bacterium]|nr:alanine racemase [Acidimicrobiales bacterium]